MKQIDTIRAALELAREIVPPMFATHAKFDDALAELAELEKAAAEPVATVVSERGGVPDGTLLRWSAPPVVGTKLYTTPPPAKPAPGMFTAEEMEAAYMEAMLDADSGAADWRKRAEYDWKISNAAKLVRERTP